MLDGKSIKGSASEKQKKLAIFQKTFGVPALYHSKLVGNYQLIFLATDDLQSDQLTRISSKQLDWLRSELNRDNKKPTIIFFHGPLYGTLSMNHKNANSKDFIAQPQKDLREILQKNPQGFSGSVDICMFLQQTKTSALKLISMKIGYTPCTIQI